MQGMAFINLTDCQKQHISGTKIGTNKETS